MLLLTDDPAVAALRQEEPVNIFALDQDPALAARYHCDKHVVKMILETAQLLSTAWHMLHNENRFPLDAPPPHSDLLRWVVPPAMYRTPAPAPWTADGVVMTGDRPFWTLLGQRIYACTHAQHPSAVWARQSAGNYRWLWQLGMALLAEYTHRYGRLHKSAPVMWTLENVPPALAGTEHQLSEPTPAMPEDCKVVVGGYYDSVASYRRYYAERKQPLLAWTRRPAPPWLKLTEEGIYALTE